MTNPMVLGICARLQGELKLSVWIFRAMFLIGLFTYFLPTLILYLLLAMLFVAMESM
jgi:phage shock protein PspC (stress-responsive transcriptional regulator)